MASVAAALGVGSVGSVETAWAAGAPQATYTATVTIPVPPASTFAGSGGGDGWAVAMTPTAVYNVFHHAGTLQVACHLQTDASPCWAPETVTDANGNDFATSSQPGLWLDQASGHLYVFATRTNDQTAGVVCIDTAQAAATPPKPFCGFTALTGAGEASPGTSGISDPVVVGTRWYAFNYVDGAPVTGAENKLLCFDLTTFAACAGQPYAVSVGSGTLTNQTFPAPATAAIAGQVIVPVTVGGTEELACYDATAGGNCSGSWPVKLDFSYASNYGAPFPLLSASGTVTGLCLPSPNTPCFSLAGAPVAAPAGLATVITPTDGWNGPAFVLGPRVYVPDGNTDHVLCYDYSTSAACANFPKSLSNLSFLYTVNPDPQRPTCIWVNADGGSGQIQNFDAFTGSGCGQGPIRVLASGVVVPSSLCMPSQFTSLKVLSPAPGTYTSGSVAFEDGDGNPIPNAPSRPLDSTGAVDLTGLNLATANGLPQFLITLVGETGAPGSVQVELTWTGADDPSCVAPGTTVTHGPPAGGPVIASLAPASGSTAGGDGVVVFGTGLGGAKAVSFGSRPGTILSVDAAGTRLVALTPPGTGTVDVTVTTAAGTSAAGAADRYAYVPPQSTGAGTAGGGTTGGATTGGTTGGGTTGGGTTGAPTTGGTTTGAATAGGAVGSASSGHQAPTLQVGPPQVLSSSSAQFTATINPEGLPTTMHFEYAAVAPAGASAAAITYAARTPEQTVGSDFAAHVVTARVAGLLPNSSYHVRAVATNPQGVTPGADATFKTATDPPPPPPLLGRTFNAVPVSGVVYVLLPGAGHVAAAHASAAKGVGFIPLTEARQLPVGTIFDASKGVARLTTATATRSRVQSGEFGGGLFRLLQNRRERGLSELRLVAQSSATKRCPPAGNAATAQTAAAKALPKTVLNLLRANVKGRFRTRGRYSAATVRGTMWTTTDRCDGTLTAVQRGVVVVTDLPHPAPDRAAGRAQLPGQGGLIGASAPVAPLGRMIAQGASAAPGLGIDRLAGQARGTAACGRCGRGAATGWGFSAGARSYWRWWFSARSSAWPPARPGPPSG